jgi:hypothetical protein
LSPIVTALERLVKAANVVQFDETFFTYKIKNKNKYIKSYIWIILAPEVRVVFRWTETRTNETAHTVLQEIKNTNSILTEGLNLYETFAKVNNSQQQICWSHIRRNFDKAKLSNLPIAEKALERVS